MAFARVLVQKPEWVFMDEATSALDEAGQANVMTLLAEELPDTAVVSIGHRPGLKVFHTRELVLEPGMDGANLRARAGPRGLRDIYRRMSAASRRRSARAWLLVVLSHELPPFQPAGPVAQNFCNDVPPDLCRPGFRGCDLAGSERPGAVEPSMSV